jgi:hypothetical protein
MNLKDPDDVIVLTVLGISLASILVASAIYILAHV